MGPRDVMMLPLSTGPKHDIQRKRSRIDLQMQRAGTSDNLFTVLNMAIITSSTQASYISFWDDNIRKIVGLIFVSSKVIGDSNGNKGAALQRPGTGFLQHGVCAFWGGRENTSLLLVTSRGRKDTCCYPTLGGCRPRRALFFFCFSKWWKCLITS